MGDFPGDYVALANLSVAGLACSAGFSVHPVAEVNVSRYPVDPDPRYRLLVPGGGSHFLNVRAVGLYRLMTAHAETGCRKAHKLARVGVSMAIVALQAQRQVRLMTVGNRLLLAV